MALDLSALDEAPPTPATAAGEPLMIRLADIEVDPNQPRKSFDPVKMAEMVASVKARGVKSPVSVRPHPDKPGKWILNYGERRYRASIDAGREEIPAFVDQQHDDYDQVIENLQREDLRPMELALFINRKKKDGDRNAKIARELGVDASFITYHLALIDPPAAIEALYASGRCTSPKILYDLSTLHGKYPDEVDAWVEQAEEVTRAAVSALSTSLKNGTSQEPPQPPNGSGISGGGNLGMFQGSGPDGGHGGSATVAKDEGKPAKTKPGASADGRGNNGEGGEGGEPPEEGRTSWPRGKVASDPTLMRKPLLLVTIDGRSAAILLNRKPTSTGLVHIRYENGENAEVSAADCVIESLSEENG
ncbi:ParB/RepB/Spo0J family partition protein [Mesorhizobium sp. J428]|uniref:ParB/RepB/Spo0J family partition protein n=1 Tax=Mesorhizobium sp. J428 TaxID=2898440 RepID=UPI002150E04B|nr:ParB/RepB/Spo0J family partition protein [Mesorhizobium sp. J428]MCR5860129.1 ParB/RepB/Spo0J family partition protein [Mesorhizobium sp. J428]MCR5860159.1 ParB/RepB/Spo0J family partition protein [Mesorhizobium sp. J428]MCR5860193.1 ParB/RepB/Spo0J family partition protein [Mesorhizobium sp. J428]MCR5860222.1 ParB/RepB/Spo0J family partition protein [Mesorhizobium sp. J428]